MILQLHCPLCLWPRWLFATHSWLLDTVFEAPQKAAPCCFFLLMRTLLSFPVLYTFCYCGPHSCILLSVYSSVWPHNTDLHPPSLYLGATCRPILFPILALMLRWFLCANNPFKGICTDCWKCKRIISLVTQFPQGWQFIFYEHTASPPPWELGNPCLSTPRLWT